MDELDPPTRREFLRGRAAIDAAADAMSAVGGPLIPAAVEPRLAEAQGTFRMNVRRRAMACDFEVQFVVTRDENAADCAIAALDLVEALEDQMTVYRDTSEVLDINRQAAIEPVQVERRLFALFELAKQLHADTNGALDITSGPLSRVWGFSRRQGRVPAEHELATALAKVGYHHVVLDTNDCSVRFLREGVELNLNSIGKGYALDRAAEVLEAGSVESFLIQGGRSSVLARGGLSGATGGWTVGLRHPLRPVEQIGEFHLRDVALSTSGSATQSFRHQGQRYGHLLDPRSGMPATGIFSATVIAPTAAEADALSTAFYVMRPTEVSAYCDQHPNVAALLVAPASREGEVRLERFGLDDSTWTWCGQAAGS